MEILKDIKKGDKIIFTYGCSDNYDGILVKKSKKFFTVQVNELNGRFKKYEHFTLEPAYIRSVGSFLKPNSRSRIQIEFYDLIELDENTGKYKSRESYNHYMEFGFLKPDSDFILE
jgi:hypothetical protein